MFGFLNARLVLTKKEFFYKMFLFLILACPIAWALCFTQKILRRQDYAFAKYHDRLPTIEELDADALELYQKRCAEATIKLWTGHTIDWKEWCDYYGLNENNFGETQLCRYITFGFRVKGNSAETERNHCYAIRKYAHSIAHPIDITRENMPYLYNLRKARITEKPPSDGSRIINNDLLQVWFTYKEFSVHTYDTQITRGAFAFANNCIRRSAEVLQECFAGLKVGNIYFDNNTHTPTDQTMAATVIFHYSKANQTGKEQSAPLFHWCTRGYICFLCEVIRIYKWRRTDWCVEMPIFQFANGKLLQYSHLQKTITVSCVQMGLDPDQYQSHGLRGGATFDQRMLGCSNVSRELVAGWNNPQTRAKYDRKIEPLHLVTQMAKEAGIVLNSDTKFCYVSNLDKLRKQQRTKLKIKNKRKEKQIKICNARLRRAGLLPKKRQITLFTLLSRRKKK